MAKRAILGGMGMSLKDGLKHSMNIFLNELYRLEDSQEGLRAPGWEKAQAAVEKIAKRLTKRRVLVDTFSTRVHTLKFQFAGHGQRGRP